MDKIRLGRTNLMVTRSGFGALPIQRVGMSEAGRILRKAYDSGINFFDTARVYSDSEEKLGNALSDVRKDIIIATKTHAADKKTLFEHLETSLKLLKTDYIDIYQLHNPEQLPDARDPEGLYGGLLEAQKKGMIRFVGITNHRLNVAMEAIESGLYDTIQYPLSSISMEEELKLIEKSKAKDLGVIAMKALSGGLITNASSTFAFLQQYDNLVPIWGIQKESELNEFIRLEKNPPALDKTMMEIIKKDRIELAREFCRGCGYCMPCPVGIQISMCARMSLFLQRSPYQPFLGNEWKDNMELIDECMECGQCKSRCPYMLDTPGLLKSNLEFYHEFYKAHK